MMGRRPSIHDYQSRWRAAAAAGRAAASDSAGLRLRAAFMAKEQLHLQAADYVYMTEPKGKETKTQEKKMGVSCGKGTGGDSESRTEKEEQIFERRNGTDKGLLNVGNRENKEEEFEIWN
jgi:hypothetical protein